MCNSWLFSSSIRLLLESYQRKQDWGFQKMISTFQHLVSGRYSTVLTFLVYTNNVHITVTVWAVYRFESKLIITCVCMLHVNKLQCVHVLIFPWIVAVPGLITSISRIIAPFRRKYLKQLPSSNNHTVILFLSTNVEKDAHIALWIKVKMCIPYFQYKIVKKD